MGCGKHTPGPWSLDQRIGCTVVAGGAVICSTRATHNNKRDPDEQEAEFQANARLISSTPDLLAALEAVEWSSTAEGGEMMCPRCGKLEWEEDGHASWCIIGNALAKARGEI